MTHRAPDASAPHPEPAEPDHGRHEQHEQTAGGTEDGQTDRTTPDPPRRRRTRHRWFVRRHPLVTVGGFVVIVVGAFAAWTAYDLLSMAHHLRTARASAATAQVALLNEDPGRVRSSVDDAHRDSARALDIAGDLPIRLGSHLPFVGRTVEVAADIARTSAQATSCLARHEPAIADVATPARIRTAAGAVDTAMLRRVEPDVAALSDCVARATTDAAAIPTTPVSIVDTARSDLVTSLRRQSGRLRSAVLVTRIAPDMLGGAGDKTYLVGLQTNAEARATGGVLGGFLVVRAHQGELRVIDRVDDLPLAAGRPLALGTQYNELYGYAEPTRLWQNSNLSPHFPYAAQIWQSLWKQRSGMTVDGVMAIDPVALGHVVSATGPLTLPGGEVVGRDAFAQLAESDVYERFANDRTGRKTFLGELGAAVFSRTFATAGNSAGIIGAFAKGVEENRISLWSADPVTQAQLSSTTLAHTVPYSPAPYAAVVVNNAAGSKLDYYLDQTVARRTTSCDNTSRSVTVDVDLVDRVPSRRLPTEVLGPPPEAFGATIPGKPLPTGYNRVTVALYSSWGARFRSVQVDGRQVGSGRGTELGHPVAYVVVTLRPNSTARVSFSYDEPALVGPVQMPIQPLVRAAATSSTGGTCGR